MDEQRDIELLNGIVARNESALRQLHAAHSLWLRRRLSRRWSNQDLVDQAIQDTFMTIWRHPDRYRGEGEVAAWLWGIAIRRLIDLIRRQRRQPVVSLRNSLSAEEEALHGVEYGELAGALGNLPTDLLDVVRATVLDGLTTREAADLLGIPQGTVKTRMMRARALLKEALA